ncbi:hypothetical protein BG015_008931 [Linnemannia schmuckeri]|uniref:FAD-binding domain-containing protein n=1 Tax=Linnemannia schmuckeri TaxID=64567 RepID=A0A9P5S5J3_9FUNG|nr:hypothetical protein BG015_008931 [Linnemannia schmuckeri]
MTISPPPSTSTSDSTPDRLRVLIVGGGIGGLMLGLMLERASIDYVILERSSEIRPLGSAISLNGTVLRVFEQLGLLEDLHKISKFSGRLHLVKEDTTTQGHVDLEHFRERYGYYSVVFGRPELLKLLVSRIPPGKLILGKRILTTARTEFGVLVRCSDNSAYEGDILVGADGAYSSIRQNMYKELKDKKMLPRSDSKPLKFDQNIVVGITDELDPEKYSALRQDFAQIHGIIGNKAPYTMWLIPIPGNRFAWSIGGRILDSEAGKEDVRSFSFAEWFPELATDVCDLVREYVLPDLTNSYQEDGHYKNRKTDADMHHQDPDTASLSDSSIHSTLSTGDSSNASSRGTKELKSESLMHSATIRLPDNIPGLLPRRQTPTAKPGTVGELIDATPNDRVSKVMLESKLFKTWHHERTVLIGDACHKVLPFAGQGAIQAILDCISLANALYDMNTVSDDDIAKAFKRYKTERFPIAKSSVSGSRSFGKLLNFQGKLSDFIRTITFNKVPTWILRLATDKLHLHRPQLTYLPMVPDRGSAKAHVQDYSPKYLAKLVEQRQKALAGSASRHHSHNGQQQQQNGDLCAAVNVAEPETRTDNSNSNHHDTRPVHHNHNHSSHRSQHDLAGHSHNHHHHHSNKIHADYPTDSSSYDNRNDHIEHNDRNDRTPHGERNNGNGTIGRKNQGRSRDRKHEYLASDFYEFPEPPTAIPTTPRQHQYDTASIHSTSTTTTTREARRKNSRAELVPPPLPTQAPPRHHPAEYLHHHPEDNVNPMIAPLRSPSTRSFNLGPQHQQQHHQQHYHQQQHRPSLVKRNTITNIRSAATTTPAASSVYSTASSSVASSPSSSPAIQPMTAYELHSNPAREHLQWSEGYNDNTSHFIDSLHHNGSAAHNGFSSSCYSQQQQQQQLLQQQMQQLQLQEQMQHLQQQQQQLPRLSRSPLRSSSTFEVENSPYRPSQ